MVTFIFIITGSNDVHEILGSHMSDLIECTLFIFIHKDSILELDDVLNLNESAKNINTSLFTYLMYSLVMLVPTSLSLVTTMKYLVPLC